MLLLQLSTERLETGKAERGFIVWFHQLDHATLRVYVDNPSSIQVHYPLYPKNVEVFSFCCLLGDAVNVLLDKDFILKTTPPS